MDIALLKENNLVFPTFLIPIIKKFSLSILDALLLTYFWNFKEETFDVSSITLILKLSESEILNSFNNLMSKKLIRLNTNKDSDGKIIEIINLDTLYQEISMIYKEKKQEKDKADVYTAFETEFGRPISSMEYEIIRAWVVEKGYSEELILGALKEAVYNGVPKFRYIDTILHTWERNGYKTLNDVNKDKFNRKNNESKSNINNKEMKELFEDYNWLDDNDR